MKPFLRRLLVFLLPVAMFFLAAELTLYSLPNTYRLKSKLLHETDTATETIVLGNSHAYFGLAPRLMPATVNLANVSQTLSVDKLVLEEALRHKKRLKRVILSVDHSNLFDPPLSEGKEYWRTTYYNRYMSLPVGPRRTRVRFETAHVASAKNKLLSYLENPVLACDSAGWGTAYVPAPEDSLLLTPEARRDAARRHAMTSLRNARKNVSDLLAIVRLCQSRGLQLWLVQPPVMPGYLENIPEQQRRLLRRLMLRCGTGRNVRVVDMQQDGRFVRGDFHDADHLNHDGARKFTKILQTVVS